MNLLPWAHQIIALGKDGEIVEQGTLAQLNAMDGYVRSFALQNSSEEMVDTSGKPSEELKSLAKSALPLKDALDKNRQTGDLTVYAYYFRAAGFLSTFTFVLFSALSAFFDVFPSMCYYHRLAQFFC